MKRVCACGNIALEKKRVNGRIYYKAICGRCRRVKCFLSRCSMCGWDKAPCDTHRIVPGKDGGMYTQDNIAILCPNCHRLVHKGLLKL